MYFSVNNQGVKWLNIFIVLLIDDLVKSIEMAKEKGPYTRFSDLPGLK